MGSDTCQQWLDVANERMVDARGLLPARSGSVGSVYLTGYAVEWAMLLFCCFRDSIERYLHIVHTQRQ